MSESKLSDDAAHAFTVFPECLLDPASGHCRASIRQYFFNTSSGHCQEFVYGGCGGNWNRFPTFKSCHKDCTCKAASETGPCRGHYRSWFYSAKDGVCRPFIFGGCGGNGNNHKSWHECSNACGYPEPNNKWWKWWKSEGRWGDWNASNATRKSARGYTQADFMKDYMILGMLGEIEMEGMGDIMNLYMQLQAMGGLSTMPRTQADGTGAGMASNFRAGAASRLDAAAQLLSEFGEQEGNGDGVNYGWGGSSGVWGSQSNVNSGLSGRESAVWGQGMSGEAGRQSRGHWDANYGIENSVYENGNAGGASGSFTPLGQRGGQGGSFTPLGESGSISNFIGTGSSNLAREMNGLGSAWGEGGIGETSFNWGSGSTSSYPNGGWPPSGGFDITAFVKSLASGSITPKDMAFMARMLGAMDRTGKIDINIMLAQFAKALSNLGMASNKDIKGVAQGFGALDINGDINMNKFLQGIAGSMGGLVTQMSRIWEGKWPVTKQPGATFVTFIRHLASGSLSPADMTAMAKMLGVLDGHGRINTNVMARSLIRALSNPGIAADLKGTANRLGAVDSNGKINVQVFLNKIANSIGSPGTSSDKSWFEILKFLTQLGIGRISPKDVQDMASKIGAVDGTGNINISKLGRWIVGTVSNPAKTADLKGVANHLGALDTNGQVNVNLLLRGLSGALKESIGGIGGAFGGATGGKGGEGGGFSRTQEAVVAEAGRTSSRRSSRSQSGYN